MFATVRAALAMTVWAAGASAPVSKPAAAMATPPVAPQAIPYQVGRAAWYGKNFHGRQTASGESFNMNEMTAAHRDLPLGTLIRVTNLKNHKAVVVRINDRGPWIGRGRIIDLSYAASQHLGMVGAGVTRVKLELLY